MLIDMQGETSFVDYRERAPAAADRDMYLDETGAVIDGASLYGHLAVGVPGTVAGMWAAHKRFGTMPWDELLRPAVELATDGFVVPDSLGSGMKSMQAVVAGKTNFDQYFGALHEGVVFRQPELAATLSRIAKFGPDDFSRARKRCSHVAIVNPWSD
jgi:gamma-glutamyltranspeptidase/glutathione hydrolase